MSKLTKDQSRLIRLTYQKDVWRRCEVLGIPLEQYLDNWIVNGRKRRYFKLKTKGDFMKFMNTRFDL